MSMASQAERVRSLRFPLLASVGRALLSVVLALVLLLIFGYLGLSAYVTTEAVHPRRNLVLRNPAELGLRYEPVQFPSAEAGISLSGWYLPAQGDRPVVMVHGLDGNRALTNTASLEIARDLVEAGYPVLMFDLRGHGYSGGDQLGLAWGERRDVAGAIAFLRERGFRGPVGLHGTSYGAATAINAAAELPDVRSVIADSPFADIRPVLGGEVSRRTGLPPIFGPGVTLFGRLLYGLDLDAIAPIRHVTAIPPRPVFYIHVSNDPRVPAEHSRHLKEMANNPRDQFWIVPGALHARAYLLEPLAYRERMLRFYAETLQ
ncbi:MAG: hypothetical protein KatS3mg061_1104 [Dehalococcoidia bacterium]|nr:MAG: hypothetical protein KatS3mg061_1104 [Dehalococcoidia bacterium]